MGALARALLSSLLGFLLTPAPGALGTNPGLVARITDEGLEYGEQLHGGGAPAPNARSSGPSRGPDKSLSLSWGVRGKPFPEARQL